MKLKQFWYAGILGIFYLVLSQPALAEEKQTKIDISKEKASVEEKTEKSISNILQLSEIQFPKTSASYLLTQENTTPAIVRITGIRFQKTETGLEVVLETPQGDLLPPTTKLSGNILIAEIQNAALSLPDSGLVRKNPVEGIASIFSTMDTWRYLIVVISFYFFLFSAANHFLYHNNWR